MVDRPMALILGRSLGMVRFRLRHMLPAKEAINWPTNRRFDYGRGSTCRFPSDLDGRRSLYQYKDSIIVVLCGNSMRKSVPREDLHPKKARWGGGNKLLEDSRRRCAGGLVPQLSTMAIVAAGLPEFLFCHQEAQAAANRIAAKESMRGFSALAQANVSWNASYVRYGTIPALMENRAQF